MDVVRDAAEHMKNPKTLTMVIYALYAASYITLVSGLAGIILNYLKRNEVADSWVATHFNWQIHTFWISLGGNGSGHCYDAYSDWFCHIVWQCSLGCLPINQRLYFSLRG